MAHTRLQLPASTDKLHRIASISKVFTRVAIERLIEQGHLSLDQKVFPDIFGNYFNYKMCSGSEEITLEHLLKHKVGAWPTTTREQDPMFTR